MSNLSYNRGDSFWPLNVNVVILLKRLNTSFLTSKIAEAVWKFLCEHLWDYSNFLLSHS
ncbi:hypothetical protein KSP40_PGU012869 [Platanthera guangdongensis]|uniref:Uncharacterized protein n=1 Tax=Platanthera guangdongensis TaxID=2320717 RepID=A0ABR2M2D0_9ASPA